MAPDCTPLQIVVIDPTSNLKPGKSLQIRSRCMLGQNKRCSSRRARRRQIKAVNQTETDTASASLQAPVTARLLPPNTLISDLAQYHFAEPGIHPHDKSHLFKAFAYNFASQSLTPFERCVVDFDCLEPAAFEWAFHDTAFLHTVLCTSYAIQDFMRPDWDGNPRRKASFHLRKALSLLQAKMGQANVHEDESVLLVVINLILLSAIFGDCVAADTHYRGLYGIVQLRGNLAYLQKRPTLHFKLDRIDLALALSYGFKPYYLDPSVTWESIVPPPYRPLPQNLYPPPPTWNYRLANVFQDFQYFCLMINRISLNRRSGAAHTPANFQATLTSLQSRLVHLDDIVSTPTEHLVRLTMLTILTTTFKTPNRKEPYGWVIDQLEHVYQDVMNEGLLQYDKSLNLWVLLTVAFTVVGDKPAWIKRAWLRTEPGLSWEIVKADLMRVMWIELVNDKPGEEMFKKLERMR